MVGYVKEKRTTATTTVRRTKTLTERTIENVVTEEIHLTCPALNSALETAAVYVECIKEFARFIFVSL